MELDLARMTGTPLTLRDFAVSIGLVAGLIAVAVRLRAPRFQVLSKVCGLCACGILLILADGIRRFGLGWQWSTPVFSTNTSSNYAVAVACLVLAVGAGVWLFRRWRNADVRSVA